MDLNIPHMLSKSLTVAPRIKIPFNMSGARRSGSHWHTWCAMKPEFSLHLLLFKYFWWFVVGTFTVGYKHCELCEAAFKRHLKMPQFLRDFSWCTGSSVLPLLLSRRQIKNTFVLKSPLFVKKTKCCLFICHCFISMNWMSSASLHQIHDVERISLNDY